VSIHLQVNDAWLLSDEDNSMMEIEAVTKLDLEAALDRVTLRMTVRFGVMLVAGLGALAAVLKFA
jgi:hypothetical protein